MTLYSVLEQSLQELNEQRWIFCGYSGNIDWVAKIQNDAFLRFQEACQIWPETFSERLCRPEIRTIEDLIRYAIYFFHTHSGGEGNLHTPDLVDTINRFLPGHFAIGGTGAQAANFLAHLGFGHVELHLPVYTPFFQAVLHPALSIHHSTAFYAQRFGEEITRSLSEIHCILDYDPETLYRIGSHVFRTSGQDRIILSHDQCNARIRISESFREILCQPHEEASFLVSGFNSLREIEDLQDFIGENERIIEDFRKHHPGCSVCVEEAHYWDKAHERIHLVAERIYPHVDSLGMNQREFEAMRSSMDFKTQDPVEFLYNLCQEYALKRVGMHAKEECLVVSAYPFEQEVLADGLGILLSGAKAYHGRFVGKEELWALLHNFRHLALAKEIVLPKPLGNGYRAFRLPTLKGIPVASTLGLGDAFTAGLLAYL
ncbi:MAG: ADP-dependent glucokinase/phosphofructokinase [Candidatus Caldatribacteriaceae bacterium]